MYYHVWHTQLLKYVAYLVKGELVGPWEHSTSGSHPEHKGIKVSATQSELLKALFLEN